MGFTKVPDTKPPGEYRDSSGGLLNSILHKSSERGATMFTKKKFIFPREFIPIAYLLCLLSLLSMVAVTSTVLAQGSKTNPLWSKIDKLSSEVEGKCITWRRDFHQNPELSNREFRTSKVVAEHL
jgi:hypothetical protein